MVKQTLVILLSLLLALNAVPAVMAEETAGTVTEGQEIFLSEDTGSLLTEDAPYEEPVEEERPTIDDEETDPIGCTAEVLTDGVLLNTADNIFGTDPWDDNEDASFDKAFDGDISTFYDAYEATIDAHVGMDVGTPTRLTEVHIVPRNPNGYDPEITVLEQTGGHENEEAYNLFDRTLDSKWCAPGGEHSVTWQTSRPVSVSGYYMYTGNDNKEYPGRNPVSWTLYGSNDLNAEWEIIDEQVENYEIPDENKAQYQVSFETTDENGELHNHPSPEYEYFKLTIDQTNNGEEFQLGEFRLLEEPEDFARMEGMTIQGSTDGERWAELYTFPNDQCYYAQPCVITADDMNFVNDYSFTQFRVINKQKHFNVAEVEFYGVDGSDLEAYPGTNKLNDEAVIFGSEGSWEDNPDFTFDKAFDGDVHTFFDPADGEQEVGIRLSNPAKLTGLRVLPRIDSGEPINPVWIHEGTEGHENESYDKLFDFDHGSKWCANRDGDNDFYVIWEMGEPVAIDGYKLVTANDADEFPERNPSEWTLYGSDDGEDWNEIHTQTDAGLPAENFAEYSVELPERADSYSFYKLEITALAGDAGTVQLSEFILLYEGCNEYAPDGWGDRMINLTVQGSVNGEDWISLYQFPDRGYELTWYDISEDMLASAAQDYAFTQFRVINKSDVLNVAEVEFYGTYDHDLDSFPTEIYEPIYSYIPAEQFVENYSHYDEWYFSDRDDDGMTRFEREFEGEDPVALIGGVGFDETDFVIDYVDGRPVFAVAPCAFTCENGIRNVIVDEGSPCRYILDNAFRGCENLETVTVSNSIYQIWCWAFNDTPKLREFIKADENLTNEEKDERGWLFVEVHDGVLTGYNRILLRYPQAKDYEPTYELPDFVEVIDHGAFCDAQIGKITMGDRVLEICNHAFSRSQAHTIELSPALKWLGNDVFAGCVNLTSLVIPSDDVEIDRWMDEDNDLTDDEYMFNPYMFDNTVDHESEEERAPIEVTAYEGSMIERYIDYIHSLEIEGYDMSHVEFNAYDGIHWLYGDWFEECEDDEVFLIGMSAPQDAKIGELPSETEDGRRIIGVCTDESWKGLCDSEAIGDENGTLVIPEGYRYIFDAPFRGCDNLKTIELPTTLRNVSLPFADCHSLEKFLVAEGSKHFETYDNGATLYGIYINGDNYHENEYNLEAFALASDMEHVEIPEGTTVIHPAAFEHSRTIKTATLPETLFGIDAWAFQDTTLESITIPANVDRLLEYSFAYCPNLTEVKIERLTGEFCRWEDRDFTTVFEGSDNVKVYVYAGTDAHRAAKEYGWNYEIMDISETVYDTYTANDGVHLAGVIPATVDGEQVTEFVIPEDVMIIDDEVFAGMNITSVTLPKTLIRIGHRAFADCGDSFEVHFAGASMIEWEGDSFDEGFDFETIYNQAIFWNQHWDGNYLYYVMPEAKEVMLRGYWYTAIDENGVMEIPSETVIDGEIYYVTAIEPGSCEAGSADRLGGHVREHAEELGWEIEDCEWTYPKSIVIPETVRYIGDEAFGGHNYWDEDVVSGIEAVKLPRNVQYMPHNIFIGNYNIGEFTGLDAYGDEESSNPYRLTEDGSVINVWDEHIFFAYPQASESTEYTIPTGVKIIGRDSFHDSKNLKKVTLPEGVYRIENVAFWGCENLETVVLPSTLEQIHLSPFCYCESLKNIEFPNGNEYYFMHEDGTLRTDGGETIAIIPFGNVPEDGVLRISEDVVYIRDSAGSSSKTIRELIIPANVRNIENWAFCDNQNLRKVTFEGTIPNEMPISVFGECYNLEEIVYYGDSVDLFVFECDIPWLIVAAERDENGDILHDEDGIVTRKFTFRLVNEEADITFGCINIDDWDDRDYETYTPEDNPYFNLIRGASVYGDVNGDGDVSEEDALYLLRHTILPDRYPLSEDDHNYDGSEDGRITAKDAAALKNNISNQ